MGRNCIAKSMNSDVQNSSLSKSSKSTLAIPKFRKFVLYRLISHLIVKEFLVEFSEKRDSKKGIEKVCVDNTSHELPTSMLRDGHLKNFIARSFAVNLAGKNDPREQYLDGKRCCEIINIDENFSLCFRSNFELICVYNGGEFFCIIRLGHMFFS